MGDPRKDFINSFSLKNAFEKSCQIFDEDNISKKSKKAEKISKLLTNSAFRADKKQVLVEIFSEILEELITIGGIKKLKVGTFIVSEENFVEIEIGDVVFICTEEQLMFVKDGVKFCDDTSITEYHNATHDEVNKWFNSIIGDSNQIRVINGIIDAQS